MSEDRTKTGLGSGKAQSGGAGPSGPRAFGTAGHFNETLAELSRRLGERAPPEAAVDPVAAKAARRAALEAYDRTRVRRLRMGLAAAAVLVVGAGIAFLVPAVSSPPVPSSPVTAADQQAAPPVEMAAGPPAPASLEAPSPSPPSVTASVPDTPAVASAATPAAAPAGNQPMPAPPEPPSASLQSEPSPVPLGRDEIREVQAKLLSFGFSPGPVDGVPGPMTEDAVMHYQRHRGQQQTGTVDRQLLEQLRQDPAPQVAQQAAPRAARPEARASRSPPPRRSDPFQPVRDAGNRLGHWLESLMR